MGQNEGHIVLYRKYRSRNFSEIVGQEHIVKPLQKSVESGKIAHAYLFTGPRGTGKTSIARIFAFAINGMDYADQLPIDIIEIDGASNRRIDEVRELKERIHTAPVQAKYKVYIIDEVHMLTKEAFNALLKTLEEPPEHAVFILATTEVHKLPATIISRTQRYGFRLVATDKIFDHLKSICEKESVNFDDDALMTIAKMGQGGLRDAISLLDQVRSTGDITSENVASSLGIAEFDSIAKIVEHLRTGTPKEIVVALQELILAGNSTGQISKQLIGYLREHFDEWPESSKEILDTIDELIEVGASLQPEVSLEIALLKANMKLNPSAKLQPRPTPANKPALKEEPAQKTEKKPDSEVEPAPEPKASKKVAPKLNDMDSKAWNQILDLVKQKNNALYSLLRMAKADYGDGVLSLQFKYDFHLKQILAQKALLTDFASQVMGTNIEVVAEVNKNLEVKMTEEKSDEVASPPAEAIDTGAKSVIDAFGGGEVISI
jgi:DNA polymerase-3 subunit gamma/tau